MFTRGSFRYPYIVRLMGTGNLICQASVAGGTVGSLAPIYLPIVMLLLNYWLMGRKFDPPEVDWLTNKFGGIGKIVLWLYHQEIFYFTQSGFEFFLAVCRLVLSNDKSKGIIMKCKINLIFGSIGSIHLNDIGNSILPFEFGLWFYFVCVILVCVFLFFVFLGCFALFIFFFDFLLHFH